MHQEPLIFDVDQDEFESRVIDASRKIPVAVDFWAEWCAPCRSLAPVLEKVVRSLAGQVHLAKVNTDQNQALAGALAIRSLPTVRLFKDAGVADEFVGAHPEGRLREFFARHLDVESDALRSQVQALLHGGKSEQALALLREAAAAKPDDSGLKLDLAEAEIADGALIEAEATLGKLPLKIQQDDDAKRLFALLHFHRICQGSPPLEELRRRVEQDPDDIDARLQLSARRVLDKDYEAALVELLELIRRNVHGRDDVARKSMLSAFQLLGRENPLVGRYRSLMAAAIN